MFRQLSVSWTVLGVASLQPSDICFLSFFHCSRCLFPPSLPLFNRLLLPSVFFSMQRFRQLALSRHGWIVVSHDNAVLEMSTADSPLAPPEWRYPARTFTTLKDAVNISRPGDTILIEPDRNTYPAEGITISHPLRILGGYYHEPVQVQGIWPPHRAPLRSELDRRLRTAAVPLMCSEGRSEGYGANQASPRTWKCNTRDRLGPSSTISPPDAKPCVPAPVACLSCNSPTVPSLIVRASSKVINVHIYNARAGGCVLHCDGALEIDGCSLLCDAEGLPHLVSPIMTCAGGEDSYRYSQVDHDGSTKMQQRVGFEDAGPQTQSTCDDNSAEVDEKERHLASTAAHYSNTASTSSLSTGSPDSFDVEQDRWRPRNFCRNTRSESVALNVSGTSLQGGCTSVKLLSAEGRLRNVRVIYEAHKTLFYFEVGPSVDERSRPGVRRKECRQDEHRGVSVDSELQARGFSTSLTDGTSCAKRRRIGYEKEADQPTWVTNGCAMDLRFDPRALQRAVSRCLQCSQGRLVLGTEGHIEDQRRSHGDTSSDENSLIESVDYIGEDSGSQMTTMMTAIPVGPSIPVDSSSTGCNVDDEALQAKARSWRKDRHTFLCRKTQ